MLITPRAEGGGEAESVHNPDIRHHPEPTAIFIADVFDLLSARFGELVDRASGPMNFRLFVMPTIVTLLAIRAGLRDARDNRLAFLWTLLTNRSDRPRAVRSAVCDIGRVFVFALILDGIYQMFFLRAFRPLEMIVMATVCAVLPYAIVRGPVTRLARVFRPQGDASGL